jgi:hypothetical protein
VVTRDADWLTPDAPSSSVAYGENFVETDFGAPGYAPQTDLPGANMDAGVNFYHWPYTSPAGSTFSNMQIDKAGNYFIAREDMDFAFYDTFAYNTGPTDGSGAPVIQNVDTGINFQPYAISDAAGWCGSTLVSDPYGVEQMAGQVTFDFAIDVYYGDGGPGGFFQTEIIPEFVMRSYGDYIVDFTNPSGDDQYFTGSAVGNNFNPITGELDENFHNQVSFLGAGIIPTGAWVLNDGTPDLEVIEECQGLGASDACSVAGASWHANAFQGKAFLFRAEADRTLVWIAEDGHSDYVPTTSPVPVPAAMWLFGSGLLGLVGVSRRSRDKT